MTDHNQQPIERGAASIVIELRDGVITVRHGTDDSLLGTLPRAPWDRGIASGKRCAIWG